MIRTRPAATVTGVILAAALAAFALPGLAGATVPVRLAGVAPTEQTAGKPVRLAARLTDEAGRPLGNLELRFYVLTDVFGPRLMSIGRGITDTTGTAAVSYKPTWEGETKVTARFAGNAQYGPVETQFQFDAMGPIALHEDAPFGLEPIRAVAPLVVWALVAAVWLVIGMVFVTTVRGLLAAKPGPEPLASPAPTGQRQTTVTDFTDGTS